MIISVHIPKCAGTSFRHVLQEMFGRLLWANYGDDFSRAAVPAGTQCIHGHFNALAYSEIWPEARVLTMVRHPVQRVVSNYHHFRREPDGRNSASIRLQAERMTLRQFAELDEVRNEITRYTAGLRPADFAYVGVAERFAESVLLLRRTLGVDKAISAIRDNVNPDRMTENYELSAVDFDHIAELNSVDLEWYEAAVRNFDAVNCTFIADPVKLRAEVARFVEQLAV